MLQEPESWSVGSCIRPLILKMGLFSVNKNTAFINNGGKEEGGERKRSQSTEDVIEVNGSRV